LTADDKLGLFYKPDKDFIKSSSPDLVKNIGFSVSVSVVDLKCSPPARVHSLARRTQRNSFIQLRALCAFAVIFFSTFVTASTGCSA
jgi:hypothetical protein